MHALWHRLLLRLEIRKRPSSSPQSLLGILLRSSGISAEQHTVDLEHAMVRLVRNSQIFPPLYQGGRFETFGFRTEVYGVIAVTIHTKDPRAAQRALANVAPNVAVSEVLVSGGDEGSRFVVDVLNLNGRYLDCDQRCIEPCISSEERRV